MARVVPKRVTARMDGDFVVFLIGMRINKPWKVHEWLPVFSRMPPFGLAKASVTADAEGVYETARGRIGAAVSGGAES